MDSSDALLRAIALRLTLLVLAMGLARTLPDYRAQPVAEARAALASTSP